MGCDVHMVLQELDAQHNIWVTVIKDVFSNRDYTFFTFLSGVRGNAGPHDEIATPGLPADFQVDAQGQHQGFWMGEHSFGHISVEDFCNAPTPDEDERRKYEIESWHKGYTVTFVDPSEEDEYYWIRQYQRGLFAFLPGPLNNFRLVFGYDS